MRGVDDDLDDDRGAERACGGRGDEPVEPQARTEGRHTPPQQERDPDVEKRIEGEVSDVGGGRERRTAAEPEVVEDVAERGGKEPGPDEEPRRALNANQSRAREAAERCKELQPLVEPRLVQARAADRQMTEVVKAKQNQARGEDRLPEPENRMGTEMCRTYHDRAEYRHGTAAALPRSL